MKLVVNAYARSGAESADRTEKTAGKLCSAASIVLVAGSGFFRSGVCGEVFDIPTVDAGGGAVPSFIAAVLPAETDSEIAVLKIDGDGRLTDVAAQCIHWDAGCFELCVLLNEKNRSEPEPARLGSVDFPTGSGRQRRVALFRDGGLRISVEESGQERSWYVCGGTDGKAHVLDVGRERLLVIHASGCRRCENSEAETPVLGFKCGCRCENLVALTDRLPPLLPGKSAALKTDTSPRLSRSEPFWDMKSEQGMSFSAVHCANCRRKRAFSQIRRICRTPRGKPHLH